MEVISAQIFHADIQVAVSKDQRRRRPFKHLRRYSAQVRRAGGQLENIESGASAQIFRADITVLVGKGKRESEREGERRLQDRKSVV